MRRMLPVLVIALAAASTGCSVNQKKNVMETALDDNERRREVFEATLRILDEKPEYVDEFFFRAKSYHPSTMDRFVANTARELKDEKLAQMVAQHLAKNPESLKQVLVQTMEAAKDDPKARQAIAEAIEEKNALASDVITDRPSAVAATLEGTVSAIADKPEARAAFLAAMQKTSPQISRYLASNPKTLKVMTKAFLSVALSEQKAAVREVLKDLGP